MPGEYDRYNMQRLLSLTANVEGEDLGRVAGHIARALQAAGDPPRGVSRDVRGQIVPMQEMFGGRALGKSFEEDQRPLRPLVEQRRRGGQHKNDSLAGARLDRLLRERQETRMEVHISEGREQPFRPDVGLVRRLCK